MATIITAVTNNLDVDISLMVPGYDRNHPVIIPASAVAFDLLGPLTEDEVEAMQNQLADMVTGGSLTATTMTDPTTFWS